MQVGTGGGSSKIDVKDWDSKYLLQWPVSGATIKTQAGAIPTISNAMTITNADQGTVLSWEADTTAYCASATNGVCSTQASAGTTYGFATTVDTNVAYSGSTSTLVSPVLQAQDGSFYGTDGAGNMVRMSQHGNVIWSVPNDYPQIATADGGVIGASGITYDSNGRATGQIANMPSQSWLGYAYQNDPGQAQQVSFSATTMASTFAVWPWGGNSTATPQQDFPPLPSCFAIPPSSISCPGPREQIYEALADLITRLQSSKIVAYDANKNPLTLGALAQAQVFDKLGSGWTTAGFISYLTNQTPLFYNGTTSNYCQVSLYPPPGGGPCWLLWLTGTQTVRDFFAKNPDTDAETDTPHNPLRTFFRPNSILHASMGMNIGNESDIFHEALHGWTGQQDPQILGEIGKSSPSCNISIFIEDSVLSYAPGLDPTHSSCP